MKLLVGVLLTVIGAVMIFLSLSVLASMHFESGTGRPPTLADQWPVVAMFAVGTVLVALGKAWRKARRP